MLRFSLGAAPETAGIYLIRNIKTKHVYIGQTLNIRRRLQEWRGLVNNEVGRTSKLFMDTVRESKPEDWELIVVRSGLSPAELDSWEGRAIRHTRAKLGALCLNKLWEKKQKGLSGELTRLSTVVGPNGQMTYAEISAACGIGMGGIAKKLRIRRRKGITTMTLQEFKTPFDKLPASA